MRQPLRLEWSAEAGESHLQALWLPLQSRSGPAGRDEIVAALHARFPKLEHVPSAASVPRSRRRRYDLRAARGDLFRRGLRRLGRHARDKHTRKVLRDSTHRHAYCAICNKVSFLELPDSLLLLGDWRPCDKLSFPEPPYSRR